MTLSSGFVQQEDGATIIYTNELPFFSAYERYYVQARKSGARLLGNKLGEKMKDAIKSAVADFMDSEAW